MARYEATPAQAQMASCPVTYPPTLLSDSSSTARRSSFPSRLPSDRSSRGMASMKYTVRMNSVTAVKTAEIRPPKMPLADLSGRRRQDQEHQADEDGADQQTEGQHAVPRR